MKTDGKNKWYDFKYNDNITRTFEILLTAFVLGIIIYIFIARFVFNGQSYLTESKIYSFNDGWQIVTGKWNDEEYESISVPYITSKPANEKMAFENTIPDTVGNSDFFSTRLLGTETKIFIGGKLRYEFKKDNDWPYRHDMPGKYVFIQLRASDKGKTIRIEETKAETGNRKFTYCYIGDKMAIVIKYLRNNGFALASGLFLVIVGAICGATGLIMQVLSGRGSRVAHIGAALFMIALWDITQSDFRDMLFTNIKAVSLVPAFCLAGFPIAMALYFNKLQKERYAGIYNIFILIEALTLIFHMILEITEKRDVLQNFPILFSFIGILMIILFTTIYLDHKKGISQEYSVIIWGTIILTICGIGQMIEFLHPNVSSSAFPLMLGTIVITVCILFYEITQYNKLNSDKQAAQKAADMKSEFLATMSHEIRTPINAVLGMNEMILRESTESNIKDYATDVDNAGNVLLALINDILDFSKLDSGKMNIVPVEYEIKTLLLGAVKMIKTRADDKGLELKLDADPSMPKVLYGDNSRINQIMINILTNAVKYTVKGCVTLRVYGEGFGDDFVLHIDVTDTGKGIKPEDKDKLFDAFTRVDEKSNSAIEGTGLGLSIVKHLVVLMNGKITVDSVYGSGSTFHVSIPQTIIDDEPVGDIAQTAAGRVKQKEAQKDMILAPEVKILAVDDTALNLKVVSSLLKKTKIQVDTCQSGEECLKMIKDKRYHMILLDHMMPGMDGVETLKRMKSGEAGLNEGVPVIMLTANAVAGAREEFLEAGFDDYLSKPFTATELQKVLLKHLPKEVYEIVNE